jgi:hypothetical protein
MTAAAPSLDAKFVAAFRSGTLTQEQTKVAVPSGDRAAFIFLLLQLSAVLAGGVARPAVPTPHPGRDRRTPSRRPSCGGRNAAVRRATPGIAASSPAASTEPKTINCRSVRIAAAN